MTKVFISVIGCLAATAQGQDQFTQQILTTMLDAKADSSAVEALDTLLDQKASTAQLDAVRTLCNSYDGMAALVARVDALEEQASTCENLAYVDLEHFYFNGKTYIPKYEDCVAATAAGFLASGAYYLTGGDGGRETYCDMTQEPPSEGMPILDSCKAILDFNAAIFGEADTASGVYTIVVANTHYDVWCDMEHDGGGWTVCYNHNLQDLEEMDHSTTERMTTVGGTPGEESEYYANCAGIGVALEPAATRICTKGCQNWIELVNAPMTFHRDFWRCDGSSAVPITVRTWTSGDTTYSRSYNHHDCPGNDQHGGNAINQIANGGNSALCFEHNSRHQSLDSNHHWAVWGSCDGTYVQANNNNDRIGWARIMYR